MDPLRKKELEEKLIEAIWFVMINTRQKDQVKVANEIADKIIEEVLVEE